MREIPLTQGKVALVDDEDYEALSAHKWFARRTIYGVDQIYAYRDRGRILMHREITQAIDGVFVDHQNHNTLDNRRCNLRLCTPSQNQANRRKMAGTSSVYKGVYWHKGKARWQAAIKVNGRHISIGRFKTAEAAALAYNAKASLYFGEFAFLNDIPDSRGGDLPNQLTLEAVH